MTLAESITTYVISLIESGKWTSASPGHVNTLESLDTTQLNITFDQEIEEIISNLIEEYDKKKSSDPVKKSKGAVNKKEGSAVDSVIKTGKLGMDPFDVIQGFGAKAARRLIPHLIALGIAEKVFETWQETGGPLETKIRIWVEKQFNALISRQVQKNLNIGMESVTLAGEEGFRNINGMMNHNSLLQIREGKGIGAGQSAIDYKDQVHGLWEVRG